MTIKNINPSSDDVCHGVKKLLSNSVFNEINRIENRNGILALFRKDVKKKRNVIEKELHKIKQPREQSNESTIKNKSDQLASQIMNEVIKNQSTKEINKSNMNVDSKNILDGQNIRYSPTKNYQRNHSKNQSITSIKNKQTFFSTELLEENNEFPKIGKLMNNDKSNVYSKNVSGIYGDLPSIVEIPHLRMRRMRVNYIPRWFESNKIPMMNYIPEMVNDLEFQSNIINDEVKVLFSDIQKFRMILLNNPNILRSFKSQDTKIQTNFNMIFEESYLLMMELVRLLVEDFGTFLEKKSSIKIPNITKVHSDPISKESTALLQNANLFDEVSEYFLNCFEVYNILLKEVDNMILPFKNFIVLIQYFARCRMNISKLTFYCDNFVKNYLKDKDLISKYLTKYKHKEKSIKKSKFLDVHKVDEIKKKLKDLNNVLKT